MPSSTRKFSIPVKDAVRFFDHLHAHTHAVQVHHIGQNHSRSHVILEVDSRDAETIIRVARNAVIQCKETGPYLSESAGMRIGLEDDDVTQDLNA
ncbi:hypothetical protein DFH27DRAFT_616598 [Peziza echinospora]|nr:hypothetical protein DFH27DRAFT_616598 [Peziza echinospora]